MATDKQLDDFIAMMDQKIDDNVGRIKVRTSEAQEEGTMSEVHHHGRCDVCSPFANSGDQDALDSDDIIDTEQ